MGYIWVPRMCLYFSNVKLGDWSSSSGGFIYSEPESSVEAVRRGQDKGKAKVLNELCFNKNGLFSLEAINLMDGRKPGYSSQVFNSSETALDIMVGTGVLAKDVLQSILLGALADLLPKLGCIKAPVSGSGAADGLLGMEQAAEFMKHGKAAKKAGP